jgi:hypothetical protein
MKAGKLEELIRINLRWLGQAIDLVGGINDAQFANSPRGLEPHRAGAHLRHVLEFYGAFRAGMDTGYVDYDARPRDVELERSRVAAIARMRAIEEFVGSEIGQRGDGIIFVRMEDADAMSNQDCWLTSSLGRELQTLSSHTIHHFALIAITLRAHGVAVPSDFGVAPATLRHGKRAA